MVFHPKEKAELLADFFEDKLTARQNGAKMMAKDIRKQIANSTRKGHMELETAITKEEVALAAKDLPGKKATGPDRMPAEFYKHCPALHMVIAGMFNKMLEEAQIPEEL